VNTSILTIVSIGALSFLRGRTERSANRIISPLNKNFWEWFRYSHAADNDGKPLILLHGTKSSYPFEQFKADMQGKGLSSMFFTNNKYIAPAYTGKNGVVFPVYLSMQSPLVLDFSDQDPVYWSQIPINGRRYTTDNIVKNAIRSGKYDGVIFKNILDVGPHIFKNKELREKIKGLSNKEANKILSSDIYAVFHPNQIKSIYNKGDWSRDTNNMFK
tara:strand:+ start:1123 stop:1770 length:648 start_codon:yes stop_codon:yes gene_type:complete